MVVACDDDVHKPSWAERICLRDRPPLSQLLKEWVLADDHEWSGSGSALLKALLTRHAGRLE
jgi:hypothetical protein